MKHIFSFLYRYIYSWSKPSNEFSLTAITGLRSRWFSYKPGAWKLFNSEPEEIYHYPKLLPSLLLTYLKINLNLVFHHLISSWTIILRMTSLPLKNISLNVPGKGHDLDQDLISKWPQQKSPILCTEALKRKSSSLELCCSEQTKENCDSSRASPISPKKKKYRPFTVSVEGNIGSGKSTFLKYFSRNPNIATYQEPIEQWTNLGGHNLLGKLYEDPDRWNFLFQSFVQLTRLQIHLDQPNAKSKLIERSFHNNRFCFLENAHDAGNLNDSEFNVLTEYYDFFEKHMNIGIDLIVYLRTSPEIVYERMKKRGRSEEASVSLEYLQGVHKYYERWLIEKKPSPPPAPVLVINGDLELDVLLKEYEKQLPIIIGHKKFENGLNPKSIINILEAPNNGTGN